LKISKTIKLFEELIQLYAATVLMEHQLKNNFTGFADFHKSLPAAITRSQWVNAGGQLIKADEWAGLKRRIARGETEQWEDVHEFYREQGRQYDTQKLEHAFTAYLELLGI